MADTRSPSTANDPREASLRLAIEKIEEQARVTERLRIALRLVSLLMAAAEPGFPEALLNLVDELKEGRRG